MYPFSQHETKEIAVLLWGAGLAALAWLARTLSQGVSRTPLQYVGGLLGAAIASFSFGALIYEIAWLTSVMKLGISGVIGWTGGDVLSALASQLESRLGWRVRED